MIAVVRRPGPMQPIRTLPSEPVPPSAKPPAARQNALRPAGQRAGSGSSSVLPYLSLPR